MQVFLEKLFIKQEFARRVISFFRIFIVFCAAENLV